MTEPFPQQTSEHGSSYSLPGPSFVERLPAKRFWMFVLLMAAVLRLVAMLQVGSMEAPQLYEYGGIARHILAGNGYTSEFPILYPEYGISRDLHSPDATPTAFTLPGLVLVTTAVLGVFGDGSAGYAVMYALNLLVALFSIVLFARLCEELFTPAAGRWTAILMSVYPPVVAAAATFGGTVWHHALMAAAMLATVRVLRSVPGASVVRAGLASGIWGLFRGEALAFAAVSAAVLWKRLGLRRAVVYGGLALVLLAPWILRNTLVFSSFVPMTTNGALNLWRGNNPDATGGAFTPEGKANWLTDGIRTEILALPVTSDRELRIMNIYRAHAVEFISSDPGKAAVLYLTKLLWFFTFDFSDPRIVHPLFCIPRTVMLALFAVSLTLLFRRRQVPVVPLLVLAGYALLVAVLHVETRYQLTVSPILLLCIAPVLAGWTAGFSRPGVAR